MPTYTDKFMELVNAQVASDKYPTLKSVTLAQWILESGRGASDLAERYNNFGGLKWREDRMEGIRAQPVRYEAHDGVDIYTHFADVPEYIPGYWAFIERGPYGDPANYTDNPRAYLEMLHETGYATDPAYVDKVWALVPEATQLLKDAGAEPPPVGQQRVKVAIVVGHNTQAPGAYSRVLGEPEYTFNERVAKTMEGLAPNYNIELRVYYRRANSGGYSAEIREVYRQVNDWIPTTSDGLCGELHFNAFNGSANGCEMWYWHSSSGGSVLAAHLQAEMLQAFSLADRGTKPNDGSQRGAASLRECATYNIVLEPFFGDHDPDARQFVGNERKLAEVYLTAYRDAAIELGLMQEVEPPPVEPPVEPGPEPVPPEYGNLPEHIISLFAAHGCNQIREQLGEKHVLIWDRPDA